MEVFKWQFYFTVKTLKSEVEGTTNIDVLPTSKSQNLILK